MSYELVAQKFDKDDPINIGRSTYFDVDKYLSCVEEMITADEVQYAFDMLDRFPGWYRDNVPSAAVAIRERLLKQFFTTLDYAKNGEEIADKETALTYLSQPHGQIVLRKCQELNDQDIIPHIEELGPGNYWLPLGLMHNGIKFTYFGPSLNQGMQSQAAFSLGSSWMPAVTSKTTLFVCFEMLEHMKSTDDIYHHFVKHCPDAKYIFISTPMYTFGGGMGEWFSNDLGHLRTYTPKEFGDFAMKYWPKHSFRRYDGHVMVIEGEAR